MLRKDLNQFHTRRSERAPMKAAVSFRNGQGEISYGWSRDVSLGGLYVHTDDRERIGTLCELNLTIKRGDETCRLTVLGQVARYDGNGIAFQFCDLSEGIRNLIAGIVEEHIETEFGPPPDDDVEDPEVVETPEDAAPAEASDDAPTAVPTAPVDSPTPRP